jgi:hypothetical protein
VKEYTSKMGGNIRLVENPPDEVGTCFEVELKRAS